MKQHFIENGLSMLQIEFQVPVINRTNLKVCLYVLEFHYNLQCKCVLILSFNLWRMYSCLQKIAGPKQLSFTMLALKKPFLLDLGVGLVKVVNWA